MPAAILELCIGMSYFLSTGVNSIYRTKIRGRIRIIKLPIADELVSNVY